jgi:hypothetical protein
MSDEIAPEAAQKRVRRKTNELTKEAERKAAAALQASRADMDPPAPSHTSMRSDMRNDMREEDPRERAARRAAEVRANVGTMDDGTDEFYIDPATVPPGWSYEWKRKTNVGAEDPAYQVSLARKGWDPVPASRHPSYMPTGSSNATIERKGMILMERPKELTDEAKGIEYRKARDQVRHKEQQLNAAPDNQFGRNNKDQSMVKVHKSYDMAIPSE